MTPYRMVNNYRRSGEACRLRFTAQTLTMEALRPFETVVTSQFGYSETDGCVLVKPPKADS